MTARLSFPRQARLCYERDFRRVYRLGTRVRSDPLRIWALRRPEGGSRLGLSISRKVGGPVVRNRWKRAIREAFRLNRHLLEAPYDLVVSVNWDAVPGQSHHARSAFLGLVEELNRAGRMGRPADGSS